MAGLDVQGLSNVFFSWSLLLLLLLLLLNEWRGPSLFPESRRFFSSLFLFIFDGRSQEGRGCLWAYNACMMTEKGDVGVEVGEGDRERR